MTADTGAATLSEAAVSEPADPEVTELTELTELAARLRLAGQYCLGRYADELPV